MSDTGWRFTDPEIGQWVEVKHKGVCQYIGPSTLSTHKYIDRNGTTHSLGNYGWRPLPLSIEEKRLRAEVERLREAIKTFAVHGRTRQLDKWAEEVLAGLTPKKPWWMEASENE